MAVRPKPERQPFDPNLGQPKKVRRPTKRQQAMQQAHRGRGGGWAAGSTVENYNDQVKRKYGGGKL